MAKNDAAYDDAEDLKEDIVGAQARGDDLEGFL